MLVLKIENLQASIDGKKILKGVDLLVGEGEVHAIMGPNGSGKSTLAYVLAGHPRYEVARNNEEILRLSGSSHRSRRAQAFGSEVFDREAQTESAQARRDDTADLKSLSAVSNKKPAIRLDGRDLLEMTPDERARRGLFLAFQYPVSVDGVSVEKFLRRAYEAITGKKVAALAFRRLLTKQAEVLGVKAELLSRSLNDGFSGGEKKRVEILQLAILKPRLAILDETDSGLDIDALKAVARGVRKIMRTNPMMGVMLITHYQRILKYLRPDFVHVMIGGKIVMSGDAKLASKIERKGYKQ